VTNYVAAILIVAAVALFVAAPLSGGFPRRRGATSRELDRERLEHERGLAVQGLREVEFDHEMGKLDEVDYRDLKRSLEDRALSAMSAIERMRVAVPELERDVERTATVRRASRAARPALASAAAAMPPPRRTSAAGGATAVAPPKVKFCPQCGVPVGAGHNFCAVCGTSLNVAAARLASRAE
jgi:zinc-ribbon domain